MGLELPTSKADLLDFWLQAATGNLPGIAVVRVAGQNPSLTLGAYEAIWTESAAFTWGTVAGAHRFNSSNANDTSAGTGAQSIYVEGLDANHNIISETKATNGTFNVTLANSYYAINPKAHVVAVGSGGINAGNIIIRRSAGSVAQAHIRANEGEAHSAIYTVPAAKTAYLVNWWRSVSNTIAARYLTRIWARRTSESWRIIEPAQCLMASTADGSVAHMPIKAYHVLPAKAEVYMDGTATVTGAGLSAGFDLILVDD